MIGLQEELNVNKMDSLQLNIMNTTFFVATSNSDISDWKNNITSFLLYIEREFSRFQQNNELWRLNQFKKNKKIIISSILYDILQKAEEYRLKTKGRFSSLMLDPLESHGYNQSFPFEVAHDDLSLPNWEIENQPFLFHDDFQITKQTDKKVDLGGIAKGYIVESIANWLQKIANSKYGIVDGGGDIAVWSNGEKNWKIGILDPYQENQELGSFTIQNGGIATSNIIYRSWWQGKTKKHHLLDGRTGMPVETPIVQATVVMKHCLDAEVGAKICFMNDSLPTKSVLSMLSDTFSYVLVDSNRKLEVG